MPPASPSSTDLPSLPGYRVTCEIARGGMGRVLAAIDLTLGREVAIKVLLPGADAKRFVTESRITARLPHPGIPPVYAPGILPDGSPFLAMKLIRGQTLAELLKQREATADELSRFLAVFEQVCQAVGFAHSQAVIHRDLKPANIMVGAFGEVQVMDWGLAKVLGDDGTTDPANTDSEATHPYIDPNTTIPQHGGPDSHTLVGVGMGTPAYMPPEQARGEWARVDERADVFALGGVLGQILTGQAVYSGRTAEELVAKATAGDTTEVIARLDACGADAELVSLCKQCLYPDPTNRPRNGKVVADAMATYHAGVEERLRTAEAARVAAEATATEQRKRRRVQLALVGAIALLIAGGAVAMMWTDRLVQAGKRKEAEFAAEQARKDSEHKAAMARAEAERQFKTQKVRESIDGSLKLAVNLAKQHRFREATEAAQQAQQIAKGEGLDVLTPGIERAKADIALVGELEKVRTRKSTWLAEPGGGDGRFDLAAAAPRYLAAFAEQGFDLVRASPDSIAARITSSPVKAELIRALDDWAVTEPDGGLRNRVLEVARRADPGPWTDRARDPAIRADPAKVKELVKSADSTTLSPAMVAAFAEVMRKHNIDPSEFLGKAQASHPSDFDLSFALAQWFHFRSPLRAVGHYRAARAVSPENAAVLTNLGLLLTNKDSAPEAIAILEAAVRLDPKDAIAQFNLGVVQHLFGDAEKALAAYRTTVAIDPSHAEAFSNLGTLLGTRGDKPGAVNALREAVRLAPNDAGIVGNLGAALQQNGHIEEAIVQFRNAIKLAPKDGRHFFNLGMAFRQKGDPVEATKAFLEANKLDPKKYPILPK